MGKGPLRIDSILMLVFVLKTNDPAVGKQAAQQIGADTTSPARFKHLQRFDAIRRSTQEQKFAKKYAAILIGNFFYQRLKFWQELQCVLDSVTLTNFVHVSVFCPSQTCHWRYRDSVRL